MTTEAKIEKSAIQGRSFWKHPAAIPLVLVVACCLLCGILFSLAMQRSAEELILGQARQAAEAMALQNRAMQKVYAEKVVKTGDTDLEMALLPGGLHMEKDLPVPPIFTRLVAAENTAMSRGQALNVSLVDGWGVNPDNARLVDAFERKGWDALLDQARGVKARTGGGDAYARAIQSYAWTPYVDVQQIDGHRVFRYLTAHPATDVTCVRCHNGMAAGPTLVADQLGGGGGGDGLVPGHFVLGDPLGALEVQIPLDSVGALTTQLRNRMIALFLVIGLAGAIFVLFLMRRWSAVAAQRFTGLTRQALGRIGGAVANVASAADAQSKNITRQAAALQETQVTTQELKQTSEMVFAKTEAILAVAERAESLGATGEATVAQTLAALTDIRSQVDQIAEKIERLGDWTTQVGDITQTVKDLADQSNMLALNAAIEAVRSGEHGKGFAVVAREIRTLADQSVQATGRVREILETIGAQIRQAVSITQSGAQRIEGGLVQVKASGDHIKELSEIVKASTAAVRQISAAVSQQNAGVSQIFTAVTDQNGMMEDTVQRLAETRAAVGVATDVSAELAHLNEDFRL